MTGTSASHDAKRPAFLQIALGGLITGVITPLLQPWIDQLSGSPGDYRIALLAVPFAILVLILVRYLAANPWWAAAAAAVVTVVAFLCAVNTAIWVDGQMPEADKTMRNVLDGIGGGFTGSAVMVAGICLLPAGPRDVPAWLPTLVIGTVAGALLAVDNLYNLDLVSVLYPVWQAGVAIGLAIALQRTNSA
ncbi:MAG TPA: hypothetical protein VGM35_06740 [Xanthobacteraceae bacterium]